MNTKAIFLFSAVFFVALNICSGASTNQQTYREKRQFGGYGGYGGGLGGFGSPYGGGGYGGGGSQIANAQSTANNYGNNGIANAVSTATNNGFGK